MKSDEKILCATPTPGKSNKRIDRWKYEAVRKAILAALPRHGEGMFCADLPDQVERRLSAGDRSRLGVVKWYTATVKLALEVRGEIVRVPGSKPQRLRRN
jgi:hypothetical protein